MLYLTFFLFPLFFFFCPCQWLLLFVSFFCFVGGGCVESTTCGLPYGLYEIKVGVNITWLLYFNISF